MENKSIELHKSVREFLDYCRTIKGLSEESMAGYYCDLKMFYDFIGQLKKKNITDRLIKRINGQGCMKVIN